MLRRLRLQLTGLYVLVALGLVAMLGLGAYSLLGYYFQRETDLALNVKMAQTFRQFNTQPPAAILEAEHLWDLETLAGKLLPGAAHPTVESSGANTSSVAAGAADSGDDENAEAGESLSDPDHADHESAERYDSLLASVFVLRVDAAGRTILAPGDLPPPYDLNQPAVDAARLAGSDLRNVSLPSGERLRLLTYRIDSSIGPFFIQAGRSLDDQDRVRNQFLAGLLGLSLLAAALLGLGSWWLSGQSLLPAQRSWDQQQTFIANASHELRTPLTLIKASAEVIERTQPPAEEQAELMAGILSEVDYMDHLIGDLLLLSRLDTHRLALAHAPVALAGLLADAEDQARPLAGGNGPAIQTGPANGTVIADPQRLRQVLLILLDNAIRHTPDGGVVRLEAERGGEDTGTRGERRRGQGDAETRREGTQRGSKKMCRIRVSDNGSGISAEHLPHVFDRFYQATPPAPVAGDPNVSGVVALRTNGLGLSIAKGIIEALDGHISLTSREGQGTTVEIELPEA